MAKKQTSSFPGCAKESASALAALTLIAGLLGVLRRQNKRKDGKR
jgi:hypothetical protein